MKAIKNNLVWFIPYVFSIYMYWFQSMPSVTTDRLTNQMHLSEADIGFLGAAYFYFYLLLQIPSGIVVDRFKPRRILLVCIFVFCVGEVVYALATSFNQAFLGRALMGLASAPAVSCAFWLAAKWNSPARNARVVGVMEGLLMVAGGVGLFVVSYLIGKLGWFGTSFVFLFMGCLIWLGTLIFVFDGEVEESSSSSKMMGTLWSQLSFIIKSRQLWLVGIFAGTQYAVMGSVAVLWGVPYAKSLYHISTTHGALLISFIYFGAAAGAATFGLATSLLKDVKKVMISVSILMFISFLIWAFGKLSQVEFIVMSVVLGFCAASYILSFIKLKTLVPISHRGTSIGFVNVLACIIGAPILQILFGLILHHGHGLHVVNFHHAFAIMIPVLLLGFGVSVFVSE